MQVEIPGKLDWLKHQNMNELTPDQLQRWRSICQLNDLLYMATKDNRDPATNRYNSISFAAFLDDLYKATYEGENKCYGRFTIDSYVDIALYSLPSLKHIVSSPSTRIIKVPQKVPVSSLKQTTAKTMRWLSKRTGRTVQEKIAPENKVLTNLTVFSADTKENREAVYLYRILYDIVSKRLLNADPPCPCVGCHKKCIVPMREINALISLHTKIKKSELAEVPPQKQSIQNNKLMCDQYYKRIWDAVRMDQEQEESIKLVWDMMAARYVQIAFWLVLSALLHESNCFIYDFWGDLADVDGKLFFNRTTGKDSVPVTNRVTVVSADNVGMKYILSLNGNIVSMVRESDQALVSAIDFSDIVERV